MTRKYNHHTSTRTTHRSSSHKYGSKSRRSGKMSIAAAKFPTAQDAMNYYHIHTSSTNPEPYDPSFAFRLQSPAYSSIPPTFKSFDKVTPPNATPIPTMTHGGTGRTEKLTVTASDTIPPPSATNIPPETLGWFESVFKGAGDSIVGTLEGSAKAVAQSIIDTISNSMLSGLTTLDAKIVEGINEKPWYSKGIYYSAYWMFKTGIWYSWQNPAAAASTGLTGGFALVAYQLCPALIKDIALSGGHFVASHALKLLLKIVGKSASWGFSLAKYLAKGAYKMVTGAEDEHSTLALPPMNISNHHDVSTVHHHSHHAHHSLHHQDEERNPHEILLYNKPVQPSYAAPPVKREPKFYTDDTFSTVNYSSLPPDAKAVLAQYYKSLQAPRQDINLSAY